MLTYLLLIFTDLCSFIKPINLQDKSINESRLKIGSKIELSGGYDYDPLYLQFPIADKRTGTVINFITGQNKGLAAVVKLSQKISGKKITGDIAVLELRYDDRTWANPTAVHIELCNFIPENKPWKDRRKGEWVEAAATVKIIR